MLPSMPRDPGRRPKRPGRGVAIVNRDLGKSVKNSSVTTNERPWSRSRDHYLRLESIDLVIFAHNGIFRGLVRFRLNNCWGRGLSRVARIVYVLFRSSETQKTLNLKFTWGKGLSLKIWGPKALSGTLFSKRDFLGTFVRKCELSHIVSSPSQL